MKSIQSRLSTGLLISLITVFIALWLLVSSGIQSLAENYIVSRLHHDMETILTTIEFDDSANININADQVDFIYQKPFSGHYYTIKYKNQTLRSRSLWDQTLDEFTPDTGEYLTSYQTGPVNQALIIVSSTFSKKDHSLTISIAEDLTPVINDINKFKNYFASLAAGALLILLVVQIFILRSGLRPLHNIKTQLTDLEQGRIKHLNSKAPSELKPLIHEINHLLNILQQRLKRSRDALSDLSHAIKKPLTVLQQLTHNESISASESSQIMSDQVTSIQQLTDRILTRARMAGTAYSGALFDFDSDLSVLLKTIKSMYPNRNIQISTQINTKLNAYFDREDLLELLGNLLDNAYKWARSRVNITAQENDQLCITIEDDGTGCDRESLNKLAQRGVRLDENVEGYGFGLAIASDIVHSYKGTLRFDHSDELGGFKVVILLPVGN